MRPKTLATNRAAGFRQAERVHESFLAAAEKRALIWMAGRMPAWINSDHLTLLGFAAQIATGVCYALARYDRRMLLAAIVCLALNWFGDSLDGTLARVRQQQRPRYGFYVDHMIDSIGRVLLIVGNLALFRWARVIHGRYRLFDIGGAIGLAGMLLMLVVASLKNTIRLYREERIR
jgi:archaetidylinositol phosphate synthase